MNAKDLKNLLEKTEDKLSVLANENLFSEYDLSYDQFLQMISTFLSDEENDYIDILKTLDSEALGEFLKTKKEFCDENNISPYEIIRGLDSERQKEFITKLEELGLSLNEKREIF